MAGHSKWANIKHRKERQDAKRGKIFTRLIKEITVASRMGGGDPDMNPRLRLAVDKAQQSNLPKDTIERAIKKGSGELEGVNYEEVRYEGYGIGGAAVMVECMTDNKTRTVADVRHAFTKYGGNMGTEGSVSFLFKHCGQLMFAPGTDEDKLMEAAIEAGAEDVVTNDDGSIEVITAPNDFPQVREALQESGFKPELAEVTMKPASENALVGEDAARMQKLLDAIEALDDVQDVYTTAVIDELTRILGIDPGLRITGFGVLDQSGKSLAYVTSGCIRTGPGELSARLKTILDGLAGVIPTCRPEYIAIEKVFVNVNPQSTLLLGQARGTAICAAVMHDLPIAEYTALQVKQAVVGNGHARKQQVQEMVMRLLKLSGAPSPDAADALACAICHAHGGHGYGTAATTGYRMRSGQACMIGRIAGKLVAKHPPQIVVDVRGIGYEVDVPMSTLYQLPATGSDVVLLTHLLVREDAHMLYGFATEAERALFRQLLKISGVGARTALAVLSGMSVADVKNAVAGQDSGRLTRIPGIGKKTAERLLLELRDKLDIAVVAVQAEAGSAGSDVVNALRALGYNDKEAQFAVKNLESGLSVTEGIRQALKVLSKA